MVRCYIRPVEQSVSGIGVLDKAARVLEALEGGGPRSLGDLVEAVGLPRATTYRLAAGLEAHGLVRRDGEGRFCLGLRLIGLGRSAAGAFPLAEAAGPALERLREVTGESVQLYVAEGVGRRCVLSLASEHALRWIVPAGSLLPMDRGSAGRALVAPYDEAVTFGVESMSIRRRRQPDDPPPAASSLLRLCVQSVEEREPGVASVSSPIVDHAARRVVAAVSVSGPIDRVTRNPLERFGHDVVQAADEIERIAGLGLQA